MSFKVEFRNEQGGYAKLIVPDDDSLIGVIDAVRVRLGVTIDPEAEAAETRRWNALQAKWAAEEEAKRPKKRAA
jgi:hypothetical protein